MADEQPDERAFTFVEEYLDFLDGEGAEPDPDLLPDFVRAQAFQMLRVLDEVDPTPPEDVPMRDDPVARRFGFDRPDDQVTISAAALKEAALARGLKMGDVAQHLTAGGRPARLADLHRLTTSPTADVDRDLAARFAAILRTSVADLEATGRGPEISSDGFLALAEARDIIEAFALEHGMEFSEVETEVRHLVSAGAYRNRTERSWFDALHLALERIARERG